MNISKINKDLCKSSLGDGWVMAGTEKMLDLEKSLLFVNKQVNELTQSQVKLGDSKISVKDFMDSKLLGKSGLGKSGLGSNQLSQEWMTKAIILPDVINPDDFYKIDMPELPTTSFPVWVRLGCEVGEVATRVTAAIVNNADRLIPAATTGLAGVVRTAAGVATANPFTAIAGLTQIATAVKLLTDRYSEMTSEQALEIVQNAKAGVEMIQGLAKINIDNLEDIARDLENAQEQVNKLNEALQQIQLFAKEGGDDLKFFAMQAKNIHDEAMILSQELAKNLEFAKTALEESQKTFKGIDQLVNDIFGLMTAGEEITDENRADKMDKFKDQYEKLSLIANRKMQDGIFYMGEAKNLNKDVSEKLTELADTREKLVVDLTDHFAKIYERTKVDNKAAADLASAKEKNEMAKEMQSLQAVIAKEVKPELETLEAKVSNLVGSHYSNIKSLLGLFAGLTLANTIGTVPTMIVAAAIVYSSKVFNAFMDFLAYMTTKDNEPLKYNNLTVQFNYRSSEIMRRLMLLPSNSEGTLMVELKCEGYSKKVEVPFNLERENIIDFDAIKKLNDEIGVWVDRNIVSKKAAGKSEGVAIQEASQEAVDLIQDLRVTIIRGDDWRGRSLESVPVHGFINKKGIGGRYLGALKKKLKSNIKLAIKDTNRMIGEGKMISGSEYAKIQIQDLYNKLTVKVFAK